jgi:mRNA-degrading endonuclease RelE of RelBE toxin-antitoxin system
LNKWGIKEHPNFFKDLDKLGTAELEIFYKKTEDKTKSS